MANSERKVPKRSTPKKPFDWQSLAKDGGPQLMSGRHEPVAWVGGEKRKRLFLAEMTQKENSAASDEYALMVTTLTDDEQHADLGLVFVCDTETGEPITSVTKLHGFTTATFLDPIQIAALTNTLLSWMTTYYPNQPDGTAHPKIVEELVDVSPTFRIEGTKRPELPKAEAEGKAWRVFGLVFLVGTVIGRLSTLVFPT